MSYLSLVDKRIVEDATAQFRAAADAADAAAADLATKTGAADAAEKDLHAAMAACAAGAGTADVATRAEAALAAAIKARDLSQGISDIASATKSKARAAVHDAQGMSWMPVIALARAEAIAASQDFEAATAALHAALARKAAAAAIARDAMHHGAALPFDGAKLEPLALAWGDPRMAKFSKQLNPPSVEAALWGAAR